MPHWSHSIPGRARLQLCYNGSGMSPPVCDHKPTQKLLVHVGVVVELEGLLSMRNCRDRPLLLLAGWVLAHAAVFLQHLISWAEADRVLSTSFVTWSGSWSACW